MGTLFAAAQVLAGPVVLVLVKQVKCRTRTALVFVLVKQVKCRTRTALGRPLRCSSLVLACGIIRQHTSTYVSIRQHTSAYADVCWHVAYVSIRHTYVSICQHAETLVPSSLHLKCMLAYVGICQRTSYIRQHMSASVSMRKHQCPPPRCSSSARRFCCVWCMCTLTYADVC